MCGRLRLGLAWAVSVVWVFSVAEVPVAGAAGAAAWLAVVSLVAGAAEVDGVVLAAFWPAVSPLGLVVCAVLLLAVVLFIELGLLCEVLADWSAVVVLLFTAVDDELVVSGVVVLAAGAAAGVVLLAAGAAADALLLLMSVGGAAGAALVAPVEAALLVVSVELVEAVVPVLPIAPLVEPVCEEQLSATLVTLLTVIEFALAAPLFRLPITWTSLFTFASRFEVLPVRV